MTDGRFDSACRRCQRLAEHLDSVKAQYPDYHAKPVPPFGDPAARLLIVGLAPGMHGANATGRPFTGDHAGILLYRTLHKFGFATAPESRSANDNLALRDCRITNAVKCLPPANKPTPVEVRNCNSYLAQDIESLPIGAVIIALGLIAHNAVLRACGLRQSDAPFAHGHEAILPSTGATLIDSYHCSRYNTQTKRLTVPMFETVFARVRVLLNEEHD